MSNAIVIAYHLIWVAYGWWLPNDPRGSMSQAIRNDPRGSMSQAIRNDLLGDLGDLHYGRKKLQPASRDIRAFYERAAGLLKFPLLTFGASEVAAIARAFADVVNVQRYTCYACAIMPDHVHLVIRKHKHLAEEMIANFQWESRKVLYETGLYDMNHPVWGGPGWKVFLDHPDDVWRTIPYVEQNPIKMRLPPQRWEFVTKYDSWPLHPGHSPNSPYAGGCGTVTDPRSRKRLIRRGSTAPPAAPAPRRPPAPAACRRTPCTRGA